MFFYMDTKHLIDALKIQHGLNIPDSTKAIPFHYTIIDNGTKDTFNAQFGGGAPEFLFIGIAHLSMRLDNKYNTKLRIYGVNNNQNYVEDLNKYDTLKQSYQFVFPTVARLVELDYGVFSGECYLKFFGYKVQNGI